MISRWLKKIGIGGYDVSAFLAHQSVEKLLKSVFAIKGRKVPKLIILMNWQKNSD